MRKSVLAVVVGIGMVVVIAFRSNARLVVAKTQNTATVFDANGKLKLPTGFRPAH